MLRLSTGIAVAFTNDEMTRIPALLLTALIALTPVMGALCAEGCHERDVARDTRTVSGCEHGGDASTSSPVLTPAACSAAPTDLVLAGIRISDSALTASIGSAQLTAASDRLSVPDRYLQLQPAPAPSRAVLRI